MRKGKCVRSRSGSWHYSSPIHRVTSLSLPFACPMNAFNVRKLQNSLWMNIFFLIWTWFMCRSRWSDWIIRWSNDEKEMLVLIDSHRHCLRPLDESQQNQAKPNVNKVLNAYASAPYHSKSATHVRNEPLQTRNMFYNLTLVRSWSNYSIFIVQSTMFMRTRELNNKNDLCALFTRCKSSIAETIIKIMMKLARAFVTSVNAHFRTMEIRIYWMKFISRKKAFHKCRPFRQRSLTET